MPSSGNTRPFNERASRVACSSRAIICVAVLRVILATWYSILRRLVARAANSGHIEIFVEVGSQRIEGGRERGSSFDPDERAAV